MRKSLRLFRKRAVDAGRKGRVGDDLPFEGERGSGLELLLGVGESARGPTIDGRSSEMEL